MPGISSRHLYLIIFSVNYHFNKFIITAQHELLVNITNTLTVYVFNLYVFNVYVLIVKQAVAHKELIDPLIFNLFMFT